MSTFKQYLTEATKTYEYKIKIAGQVSNDFGSRMETALQKFEVKKLSAGKKTPIQSLPLDFPAIKNESVTIYDLSTSYPASVRELKEYIADYMKISPACVVVRTPGEPTEEYQEQIANATKSDYKNKLHDIEYKDAPKTNSEDFHSTKANMSLLKELLKDREKTEFAKTEKTQEISTKEEEGSPSPITAAHKGPVKGNPVPPGK